VLSPFLHRHGLLSASCHGVDVLSVCYCRIVLSTGELLSPSPGWWRGLLPLDVMLPTNDRYNNVLSLNDVLSRLGRDRLLSTSGERGDDVLSVNGVGHVVLSAHGERKGKEGSPSHLLPSR